MTLDTHNKASCCPYHHIKMFSYQPARPPWAWPPMPEEVAFMLVPCVISYDLPATTDFPILTSILKQEPRKSW